jgi:hypothetical protein
MKLKQLRTYAEKTLVWFTGLWYSFMTLLVVIAPKIPGYEWGSPVFHIPDTLIGPLVYAMIVFLPMWSVIYIACSVLGRWKNILSINWPYFLTATVLTLGSLITLSVGIFVKVKDCPAKGLSEYKNLWWCSVETKQFVLAMLITYVLGLAVGLIAHRITKKQIAC